ncbi:MAG: EAL domain-containing protein, partial [Rhodoferax sp.]|nr:EAL domain-containing protein [Rhodoferax sp.]
PSWSYFDALEHIVASVDVGQLKMLSAGIRSVMASALPIFKVDYFCHDGEMERWFTLHATPLGGSPGVKGVVVTHRDITERRNALEKLQLAASIFFHAQEGILITSSDGIIVDINESFEIMSGYTRAELIGNNPRILSSGRQDRLFYSAMWHELTTKGHWTGEIWNRRKGGEVYAVQQTISAVRSDDGNIRQFISLGSDITSSKNHQREIERVFHYDVLTKLPNRVLFSDRIRQKLAHAKRSNETVAVLCMDLDDFKGINDEFGLHAGDQILIQVADRLRMNIRLEDTVARLGGDEFVVLLGDIPSRSACDQIIRHLLEELALPYALPDGRTTDTSASIGYTLFPEDDADPDTLIRHADHAMFLAKQAGKNRSSRFDISVDNRNKANWSALAKVERGIDRGEFKLFLQPKVSLSNGAVVGAEALIRWMHPIRGLTTPGHFLPLLEGQPTMLKLGSWVLREAFQMLRNWNELGIEIPMSVNVDAMQLRDSEFSKELSQLLLEFPSVPASRLELEIVESAALDDVQKVSILIDECHTLGAKFSLDDFGTGYSSLTYLKRLAVDTLKIDQSFVRDMLGDESALAIVRGVIGLADAFTAHTVAEGVETWEHAAKLRSLNCQIIQGYVIARPMPAERFPAWMEQFTMPDF